MALTNIHNFDLNIENYKDEELQDIFGIPSTFNHEMIRHKADVLRKMVLKDSTISQQIKNNTINFINKAHEKLSLQLPTSPILWPVKLSTIKPFLNLSNPSASCICND